MTLATPPVSDPASAVAVARCVLARTQAGSGNLRTAIDSGHPRPCEWCPYPPDVLLGYARAFRAYAFDAEGHITDQASIQFNALPRREQRRLRYLAQYGEEPPARDGSVQTGLPASAGDAGPGSTADRDSGMSGGTLDRSASAPDSPAVQPGPD